MQILKKLNIDLPELSPIYTFIDFGNVNYWFEKDKQTNDKKILSDTEKFAIDIEKLSEFTNVFSMTTRFYYGVNTENRHSIGFIDSVRRYFGKYKVVTKPIQKIKHYLDNLELKTNTRTTNYDKNGRYVYIPKCNFDVEICVDAIRLINNYKTFCIFSSDADFVRLFEYLKKQNKNIILFKGGHAQNKLIKIANHVINAQDIKEYITCIKQKSSS